MKELFKNRNYLLLFQGSLMSAIGTSLYGFAAGLFVQDIFKDVDARLGAYYLALFMFVGMFIQVVFSPLAGVLVDKWNKVRILYITDWIRGIVFLGAVYGLRAGLDQMTLIYTLLGVTIISAFNQAFFNPASASVIPEVVGENMIQQANGANSIIQSVQMIAGVIAGMFLYELLGFETAVLINAISFMASAVSEMFIRTNFKKKPEEKDSSFMKDFKFGLRFIRRKQGFLTMMLFALALNFAFTPLFAVGIPYLFRTELGSSTYEIGIMDIVFSIAMLIAGIYVGSLRIKSLKSTVQKGLVTLTISFVLTSLFVVLVTYGVINYWVFYGLFLLANVLLAITMMYTNVPLNTAMMKAIDPEMRGRVFGTISAISSGAIPFSIIIAGVIVAELNTAVLAILCSALVTVVTVLYVKNEKISKMLNSLDEVEQKTELREDEMVFE
jgi:MFS family permease